ncbi:unnamed protein product [Schistosoma margrebowiei]|uniref:Uncharacterized protein n=1 Tax=Schistosoma margrebowiei TaxID=48269 RepID=A0A3P7XQJ5_9TREM|nr:unnamed protein product [Schistosoma margrebowiei]
MKAFQDRYSDLMDQFIQIQHNPTLTNGHLNEMDINNNNNTHDNNNSIILRKSSQTPAFIKELYTQLNNISNLLNENNHQIIQNYELSEHIQLCIRLINSLDNWINSCLTQNDMEIAHLRLLIMNMQLCNNNSTGIEQNTTIFTSSMNSPGSNDNNEQNKQTVSFSCSISINKKQDPSKFLLNEQELFNLREKLRLTEAQLQLTSMMQTT